jgi:hydrogenase maturation protease
LQVVVFGWGNESRGDDGLGPLLLGRIEAANFADVATVEDYQLQIEHALDLEGAELALFVDATRAGPAPFAFAEIFADESCAHTTHALAPQAVLDVFRRVRSLAPPPAFALAVRGERFELGEPLSADAAERLEAAWSFIGELMRAPSAAGWRALARAQPAD